MLKTAYVYARTVLLDIGSVVILPFLPLITVVFIKNILVFEIQVSLVSVSKNWICRMWSAKLMLC